LTNAGEKIFKEISKLLDEHGLILKEGTAVDATIISAPSSTKNKEGKRDPEMHQTKKGNQWHFGMKAHIGVDAETGVVHSMTSTPATIMTLPKRTNYYIEKNKMCLLIQATEG